MSSTDPPSPPYTPHGPRWSDIVEKSIYEDEQEEESKLDLPPPSYDEVINNRIVGLHLSFSQQSLQIYKWTLWILDRIQEGKLSFVTGFDLNFENPNTKTKFRASCQRQANLQFMVQMTYETAIPCHIRSYFQFFNEKSDRAFAICRQGLAYQMQEPMMRKIIQMSETK